MGTRGLASIIPFTVLTLAHDPGSAPRSMNPGLHAHNVPAAARHDQPASPSQPAKGRFLIASRTLSDPNFAETVLLMLSADTHGAMGVIINRPSAVPLASVLPDVKELHGRADRVFLGGPVGGNLMLVLIRAHSQPTNSEKVVADVYATGNLAALRAALGHHGKSDNRLHAYAGYAGWGPGQLEREIARGDWLLGSGDAATIFDLPPEEIWPKLLERFSGAWTKDTPLPRPWFVVSGW